MVNCLSSAIQFNQHQTFYSDQLDFTNQAFCCNFNLKGNNLQSQMTNNKQTSVNFASTLKLLILRIIPDGFCQLNLLSPILIRIMSLDPKSLKLDQIARNLCKPLGCRVVRCISSSRPGGCSSEMAALNSCIQAKRKQIDSALAEGRSIATIKPILEECSD